jgi:transcription initiation factor TFIID TATA-box-binding protein
MFEAGVNSGSCIELQCHDTSAGATCEHQQPDLPAPSLLSQLAASTMQRGTWIPDTMHPRVSNIVATVKLSCHLSLQSLNDRMSNTEYNPRRFSALIARTKSPKTTALINASGKLVILGARTLEELEQGVRLHVRAIRKAGNPTCTVEQTVVNNMVASCNIFAPLRLEALQLALGGCAGGADLDMEIFPAIIYKLHDPSVTMLIFASGKINITGASSHSAILAALEKVLPIVLLYKRD